MFGLQAIGRVAARAKAAIRAALAPAGAGAVRGLLADLTRTRQELLAENAFLRQQLVVAARRVKERTCARRIERCSSLWRRCFRTGATR
jgi:hypothetical protein